MARGRGTRHESISLVVEFNTASIFGVSVTRGVTITGISQKTRASYVIYLSTAITLSPTLSWCSTSHDHRAVSASPVSTSELPGRVAGVRNGLTIGISTRGSGESVTLGVVLGLCSTRGIGVLEPFGFGAAVCRGTAEEASRFLVSV